MEDYLNFKKMITPIFIRAIFWILVGLCVLVGLGEIVSGAMYHFGGGAQVLAGFLTLFIGPVFVRIWCEILIVLFSINDTLTEIRDNTRGMGGPRS
jgi:hypothetical protein